MKRQIFRKIFMIVLTIALMAAVILSLSACGANDEQTGETTSVSAFKSGDGWTELAQPLSREGIDSFAIKSSDMSIEDARKLCVDFFRYCKTAVWIPNDNYVFYHDTKNTKEDTLISGQTYGGVPYISMGSGNIYRLLDYMDPETGVVDVAAAGKYPRFFGNQCSFGSACGWGRVINSARFNWTEGMVQASGFLRLGSYTYDDILVGFSSGYGTDEIASENGMQTMLESYAQLKVGDGVVYFTTAGHVVMIASDAHVEYKADGTIDPDASYVTIIDQAQTWAEATNEVGDAYTYQKNVDAKRTFTKLYNDHYLPFTFAEWLGTDPIEDTEIAFSHKADTISLEELFKSSITCNYCLSDVYAVVHDSKGNEVLKIASRASRPDRTELKFFEHGDGVTSWGDLESLDSKNEYTVDIVAQVYTGERPTVWTGKLSQ